MGKRRESEDEEVESWLEREVAGCQFEDARLGKRFRALAGQFAECIGGSIPFACQDWANTKAAYRFLANGRVSEERILGGHFLCTRERFAAAGPAYALVLHDTTEFLYRREEHEAIGMVHKLPTRYASQGRARFHTSCGVLMHSSLVVGEACTA